MKRPWAPPIFPYRARCYCLCGWHGIGLRRNKDDFPACPRCGRIAARGEGPSLTVLPSPQEREQT